MINCTCKNAYIKRTGQSALLRSCSFSTNDIWVIDTLFLLQVHFSRHEILGPDSWITEHPLQRVKAKWNNNFRFGGKSAAASNKASHAASKSLLFSFVLDTFQAISVIF